MYDRGDGVLVSHDWSVQVSVETVRAIVAGRHPGVRIEDPRGDRILVMGSFLYMESIGSVYRLDHWDSESELIHGVWPD